MTEFLKTSLFASDLEFLKKHNRKLLEKVKTLCYDISHHPFDGLGKPEPLKYQFSGIWSRRIDKKNRLLYMPLEDGSIKLISCRGHYRCE